MLCNDVEGSWRLSALVLMAHVHPKARLYVGVTALEAALWAPVPTALRAATLNV
jgi:hypothetical protein